MRRKNENLHGNVPDSSQVALLLVDVINDLAFEGNRNLLKHIDQLAARISALKRRSKKLGIPTIYVNDNFGRWKSDFNAHVAHCLGEKVPGRILAEKLKPEENDYFVLKSKHSGFFSTTLDTLLKYLGTKTLILTGIAGDRCVLFTANDAYLRDYEIFVPVDCVVSNTPRQNQEALKLMERVLRADVQDSSRINLSKLKNSEQ